MVGGKLTQRPAGRLLGGVLYLVVNRRVSFFESYVDNRVTSPPKIGFWSESPPVPSITPNQTRKCSGAGVRSELTGGRAKPSMV